MAWVKRGKRRYYYQSIKVNGNTTKLYLGSGPAAQEAADEVQRRRTERSSQRTAEQTETQRHADATAPLDQLCEHTDLLMKATLISQGFYQHDRGEWRRRNGTRND